MAAHATTVQMTVNSELVDSSTGEPGAMPVTFAYRTDEPYSVFLRFHDGQVETGWEIGRELLREALERSTAGYGDVRTVNLGPSVLFSFTVGDAYATFLFDRRDLRAFLRATAQVVTHGDERIDFDAELDALLKDGAR